MGVLDVLWIFFMVSALQPVLKQKLLESARYRMIASLERKRGSRVILLVHRQETMSLLGFPVFRYIDVNDSEEGLQLMQLFPQPVRQNPSVEYLPAPRYAPTRQQQAGGEW